MSNKFKKGDAQESDLKIAEPDFKAGDRFIVKSSHISSALCGFFVVTFDGFLLEDGESFFIKSKHLEKETPATHVKEEELKVGDRILVEGVIKESSDKDDNFMVYFPFFPMDMFVNKSRIVKKVN